MSSTSALRKQLKIKTGSFKRLTKEHTLYTQEADTNRRKADQAVEDGVDEWHIKNAVNIWEECTRKRIGFTKSIYSFIIQRNMVEESLRMVDNQQKLIARAKGELQELVVRL
jgi:tubulin-specific chaperone A